MTEIDRDHQQIANRFETWPTHVRTTLTRTAETISLHYAIDILGRRKTARHINVVIVPTQEEILAEVEVLFFAMAGDRVRETRTQPAPAFPAFLPGRDFSDLEAGHG